MILFFLFLIFQVTASDNQRISKSRIFTKSKAFQYSDHVLRLESFPQLSPGQFPTEIGKYQLNMTMYTIFGPVPMFWQENQELQFGMFHPNISQEISEANITKDVKIAIFVPFAFQEMAMYESKVNITNHNYTKEELDKVRKSNIFLNERINMYIFEVPEGYQMNIDLGFMRNKIISALHTKIFTELVQFSLKTKDIKIISNFVSNFHYNCSQQVFPTLCFQILAIGYLVIQILGLRMVSCENIRFQNCTQRILIILIAFKCLSQLQSMVMLNNCPWASSQFESDYINQYGIQLNKSSHLLLYIVTDIMMLLTNLYIISGHPIARDFIHPWQVKSMLIILAGNFTTGFEFPYVEYYINFFNLLMVAYCFLCGKWNYELVMQKIDTVHQMRQYRADTHQLARVEKRLGTYLNMVNSTAAVITFQYVYKFMFQLLIEFLLKDQKMPQLQIAVAILKEIFDFLSLSILSCMVSRQCWDEKNFITRMICPCVYISRRYRIRPEMERYNDELQFEPYMTELSNLTFSARNNDLFKELDLTQKSDIEINFEQFNENDENPQNNQIYILNPAQDYTEKNVNSETIHLGQINFEYKISKNKNAYAFELKLKEDFTDNLNSTFASEDNDLL